MLFVSFYGVRTVSANNDPNKNIAKAKVVIVSQLYTGSPVELSENDIDVFLKNQPLVLGTDYIIDSYQNNINKGTAKVTIKGINDYWGSQTVSFRIVQEQIPVPAINSIILSEESGIYSSDTLKVQIHVPKNFTIAYTTDGTTPQANQSTGKRTLTLLLDRSMSGTLVSYAEEMTYPGEPLISDNETLPYGVVLRVAAVDLRGTVREYRTEVYLLAEDLAERYPDCLIVSLAADPADLPDYERGILVKGAIYDEWKETDRGREILEIYEKYGLQYNFQEIESNISQHGREWERTALMQIYEAGSSSPGAEMKCGIRVKGGLSRKYSQRSFNLYFRKDYGSKTLKYELFPDIDQYKSFSLRNGGNAADQLKFKDALLQDLLKNRSFSIGNSRPAILFINGEYWGPYCLEEKLSDSFIQEHYGVDTDNVVMMKDGELEEGEDEDILLYDELLSFIDMDLSDDQNYELFSQVMDLQSMAEYCAAQIYIGNADWQMGKNEGLWRSRDDSFNQGRWQYILYDTEYSSGLWGLESDSVETDHFQIELEKHPLFASVIQNPSFQALFLDALRSIGTEELSFESVETALERYVAQWEPLMQDYYLRFGSDSDKWEENLQYTKDFFRDRYAVIVPIVEAYFAE